MRLGFDFCEVDARDVDAKIKLLLASKETGLSADRRISSRRKTIR
jgi:hypothetical protein